MIEKLSEKKYVSESEVVAKLNQLIDAHNNHFHHARELQFGTNKPSYPVKGNVNESAG